jgi:hypothetical protein
MNVCDVNSVAGPDNLHYIAGTNTLIVGEDTGAGMYAVMGYLLCDA